MQSHFINACEVIKQHPDQKEQELEKLKNILENLPDQNSFENIVNWVQYFHICAINSSKPFESYEMAAFKCVGHNTVNWNNKQRDFIMLCSYRVNQLANPRTDSLLRLTLVSSLENAFADRFANPNQYSSRQITVPKKILEAKKVTDTSKKKDSSISITLVDIYQLINNHKFKDAQYALLREDQNDFQVIGCWIYYFDIYSQQIPSKQQEAYAKMLDYCEKFKKSAKTPAESWRADQQYEYIRKIGVERKLYFSKYVAPEKKTATVPNKKPSEMNSTATIKTLIVSPSGKLDQTFPPLPSKASYINENNLVLPESVKKIFPYAKVAATSTLNLSSVKNAADFPNLPSTTSSKIENDTEIPTAVKKVYPYLKAVEKPSATSTIPITTDANFPNLPSTTNSNNESDPVVASEVKKVFPYLEAVEKRSATVDLPNLPSTTKSNNENNPVPTEVKNVYPYLEAVEKKPATSTIPITTAAVLPNLPSTTNSNNESDLAVSDKTETKISYLQVTEKNTTHAANLQITNSNESVDKIDALSSHSLEESSSSISTPAPTTHNNETNTPTYLSIAKKITSTKPLASKHTQITMPQQSNKNPEFGNIQYAFYLLFEEKTDEAIEKLTQLDTKMPNQPHILIGLGRCYQEKRNYELARKTLKKAQQFAAQANNESELISASIALSMLYKKTFQFKLSEETLKSIHNQNNFKVITTLINLYKHFAHHDANPKKMLQAMFDKCEELKKINKNKDEQFLCDIYEQQCLFLQNKKIEAEKILFTLQTMGSKDCKLNHGKKLAYIRLITDVLDDKKNTYTSEEQGFIFDKLEEVFSSISGKFSDLYLMQSIDARILKYKNPSQAIEKYEALHQLFPYQWAEYISHIYILTQVFGDHDGAIKIGLAALKLEEENKVHQFSSNRQKAWLAAINYWIAYAHYEKGELLKAKARVQISIDNDPRSTPRHTYSYYSLLGKCTNNPDEKNKLFDISRTSDPDHFEENHPTPLEQSSKVSLEEAENIAGWGRWGEDDSDDDDWYEDDIKYIPANEKKQPEPLVVNSSNQFSTTQYQYNDWEDAIKEPAELTEKQPAPFNFIEGKRYFSQESFFSYKEEEFTINAKNNMPEKPSTSKKI